MANPQLENGYTSTANELFEAECKIKMAGSDWQVYQAIKRITYGWNKKTDRIAYSQIETLTGLKKSKIFDSVQRLKERKMVVSLKTGTNSPQMLGINKNYEQWKASPKKGTVHPPKRIPPKKVKAKNKIKPFVKPKVEDVEAHIEKMGYHFSAPSFMANYKSKGWKIGSTPMVSWKAACTTWEENWKKRQKKNEGQRPKGSDAMERVREEIIQARQKEEANGSGKGVGSGVRTESQLSLLAPKR